MKALVGRLRRRDDDMVCLEGIANIKQKPWLVSYGYYGYSVRTFQLLYVCSSVLDKYITTHTCRLRKYRPSVNRCHLCVP